MRNCALVLAVLMWPLLARGGLTFEERELDLTSTPRERSVDGVFRFKNTGSEPVTIRKVHTNCGCTSVKLEKKTYAPGETGEFSTTFKYWFEKGPLRKLLSVELESGERIPLELRVLVRPEVEIKPALVYWRLGDKPDAKEVQVSADADLELVSVESTSPGFEVEREEVRPGSFYRLRIRPTDTSRSASARIHVVTTQPRGTPRSSTVHARVK